MIDKAGLQVAPELATFIDDHALPGTGIAPDAFWRGVADIFARFTPENRVLLARRDDLQRRIDAWYVARAGQPIDGAEHQAFLRGALVEQPLRNAAAKRFGIFGAAVGRIAQFRDAWRVTAIHGAARGRARLSTR